MGITNERTKQRRILCIVVTLQIFKRSWLCLFGCKYGIKKQRQRRSESFRGDFCGALRKCPSLRRDDIWRSQGGGLESVYQRCPSVERREIFRNHWDLDSFLYSAHHRGKFIPASQIFHEKEVLLPRNAPFTLFGKLNEINHKQRLRKN